jgi:ribosome-associated protein
MVTAGGRIPGRVRKGPRVIKRTDQVAPGDMAVALARAAEDRKAEDIVVLDLRGRSQCADYFVLATGSVQAHLDAVVRAAQETLAAMGERAIGRGEAAGSSGWALLDCAAVILHVFTPEVRNYYDMELLWGDAPRIEWNGPVGGP